MSGPGIEPRSLRLLQVVGLDLIHKALTLKTKTKRLGTRSKHLFHSTEKKREREREKIKNILFFVSIMANKMTIFLENSF